jgi:hypothetical protein
VFDYFSLLITDIVKSLIEQDVFGVDFGYGVIARDVEYKSVAFAAHTNQGALFTASAKFGMIPF